jgi:hypothetical protein
MILSWIDVADTAIKIGLGSLIMAFSGYFVLRKTHEYENNKEKKQHFYKCQEERKIKYIDFLSQSQALVQEHLSTNCSCKTEDYKNYLRTYSEVQIISPDKMQIVAYELLSAVNQFIVINKNGIGRDLERNMRKAVNDKSGMFQKMAQIDATQAYDKNKTL